MEVFQPLTRQVIRGLDLTGGGVHIRVKGGTVFSQYVLLFNPGMGFDISEPH